MTVVRELEVCFSNLGWSMDDEWEKVEPAHLSFWENDSRHLENFSYQHSGCSVAVNIDWAPYQSQLQKIHEIFKPGRTGGTVDLEAYKSLPTQTVCLARIEIVGTNNLSAYPWYAGYFLDLALYDAFICANIAFPGVLDLHNAEVSRTSENMPPVKLNLSSYNFEFWWIESLRGKFPKLERIPLKLVRDWHAISGMSGKLRAQTGLERAIFCVYHLCRSENYVDGLIWIFHALEALLDTRVGENFSAMLRRISMLLDLNERDKKILRKTLRHAYDIRSSFVHGGYVITHPIHNEVIDPEIGKAYSEGLELQQFGLALLISILQKLVKLGASNYHFREVFVPHLSAS